MGADRVRMLLIEDDPGLCRAIREYFEREGFAVVDCPTAEEGVARVARTPPDVVLLDLMLAGVLDGISACREMRRFFSGPILMLTAKGQDMDQVAGLEVGADDYVVKPAAPRVLLARVRTLIRRQRAHAPLAEIGPLAVGAASTARGLPDRHDRRTRAGPDDCGVRPARLSPPQARRRDPTPGALPGSAGDRVRRR